MPITRDFKGRFSSGPEGGGRGFEKNTNAVREMNALRAASDARQRTPPGERQRSAAPSTGRIIPPGVGELDVAHQRSLIAAITSKSLPGIKG